MKKKRWDSNVDTVLMFIQLIFAILFMTNVISWPLWIIFLPSLIFGAILVLAIIIIIVYSVFMAITKR